MPSSRGVGRFIAKILKSGFQRRVRYNPLNNTNTALNGIVDRCQLGFRRKLGFASIFKRVDTCHLSTVRRTEGQKDRRTEGQKDRRTEGQKDRRTEGQKDRRTEGQKVHQP
jgi:hypothetical protein